MSVPDTERRSMAQRDETIVWLRQYQESLRREKLLRLEIEQLRAQAERVTPLLSPAPGGKGPGGRLPLAVERLDEARRRLEAELETGQRAREEILGAVGRLSNSRAREILRRRYILGQKWEQIYSQMHLEARWVMRLHRQALEDLAINDKL